MAYENDVMMRQVRDMARMLAKILFGKDTPTYELEQNEIQTSSDDLYSRLIAMVKQGKINQAENVLYDELDRDEDSTIEVALGFYDYLNELPAEFLVMNEYSREEINEGIKALADRKGLGAVVSY